MPLLSRGFRDTRRASLDFRRWQMNIVPFQPATDTGCQV